VAVADRPAELPFGLLFGGLYAYYERLAGDPALALMARVVHGADVSEDSDVTPQSHGLQAIADGFALLGLDDQIQLELELPVYDALYAWARTRVANTAPG
jgi:hypothetical protein